MGAWIWAFSVAATTGVWLGPAGPAWPPWLVLPLLFPLAAQAGTTPRRCLLAALCGYLFAMLALGDALGQRLPMSESGQDRQLAGQVEGLPEMMPAERGGRRQRFLLRVHEGGDLQRVALSFYRPERPLRPGEFVRLTARLYTPRARLNEAGFDRARHDLASGVDAHGYVLNLLRRGGNASGVDAFRDRLGARMRARLAHWPVASRWLPALVTGDRRHISDDDWQLLRRSGTVHLMAISGLHVTLVAGLVWWLFRRLPLALAGRFSAQQLAVPPALGAATGYAVLAGLSLPTQRALVMTALVFLSLFSGKRRFAAWYLAAALMAVLLWHPLAPLAIGFWLSFGAVALLMVAVSGGWRGVLRAQLLLGLGLGAVTSWLFGDWGVTAPLANLILIPLFSLVVVPLSLIASLCGWPTLLAVFAGAVMQHIHAGLDRLVALSPSLPPVDGALAAACVLLALALLISPAMLLPRWVAPFLLLPVLAGRDPAPANGHFHLVVFDVGQGQAVAIRTRTSLVLYDLGPSWPGGDAGGSLIGPWLARQDAAAVLAFASHGDDDHAGGLRSLAERLPPGRLFSGEPARVPGAFPCLRGQRWWLDGVRFEVLWPAASVPVARSNNRSCVLSVTGSQGRVLLTGDIEKPVEYWLARHEDLRAGLLQVPHHGSASSSSYTLLHAVRPDRAFAASGHLNAFNHPAPAVRRRYREAGVPLEVTANTGMIVFRIDDQHNAAPERWRATRYRPWRAVIE